MEKGFFLCVLLVLAVTPAIGQDVTEKISVRAVMVGKDLNQKPVPRLTILIAADPTSAETLSADTPSADTPRELKTNFEGIAEVALPPGKYKLTTPTGVDFQGHHFAWEMTVDIGIEDISVELSNDNARITDLPSGEPSRKVDDLTAMFRTYEKSVVTVWSEIGSGSGFIVDSAGLVMTNQHVIGPSELISVQFDATRKVVAKVLAFDAERDVAVLYFNPAAFPDALTAPIAVAHGDGKIAVEGERVFTIGSPLGLKKIITSGIVSRVEERAIISDVNINHGNSGGPLFNSLGEVIGITTFLIPGENGPGVSGIVRIDQTLPTLEQARKKMKDIPVPSARKLPVEPTDPYPLSTLNETIRSAKLDMKPYVFTVGGFNVALGTPVLDYQLREGVGITAAREKSKRVTKRNSAENNFEPLQDVRGWSEYVGQLKPILFVQAEPQLRETFLSEVGRTLAPPGSIYGFPARMKFRSDFLKMKLFCGEKEVEPIQPGKAATIVNAHTAFVSVTDATYVGIYSYPPDAISPACGKVRLQLFSESEPDKPESKDLEQKSIDRVWSDFRPYLMTRGESANAQ